MSQPASTAWSRQRYKGCFLTSTRDNRRESSSFIAPHGVGRGFFQNASHPIISSILISLSLNRYSPQLFSSVKSYMLISVPESTSGKLIYPDQKLENGGVLSPLTGFISDLRHLLSTAAWYCVPLRMVCVSTKPNTLVLIPKSRSLISKVAAVIQHGLSTVMSICSSKRVKILGESGSISFLHSKTVLQQFQPSCEALHD